MTNNSGADGIQTPPSLVTTPRGSPPTTADHTPATLGEAAARLAAADPSRAPLAHMMHDLWLAARHSRRDAVGVHAALRAVAARVAELQAALAAAHSDLERLERAAEIRIMEKDCEIRMAQSEAAAHAMAAQARAATAAALQASVAALQEEKERGGSALAAATAELEAKSAALTAVEAALENSNRRAEEQAAAAQTLREELDALRCRVPDAAALEAARGDAAAAAGQLVDACEENARLSEEVAALETALRRREAEVASLRAELEAARARGPSREMDRAPQDMIPDSAFSRGSRASSSPRLAPLALALPADADPEDLLAVEVSRLRGHTEELEAQLAEARSAAPLLQALEAETTALRDDNAALRAAADRAAAEAGQAQTELQQVQSEARALHGQLAEVIASLAGGRPMAAAEPAGLLPAPPLLPPQPPRVPAVAASPAGSGASVGGLAAAAAVRMGENRHKGLAAALSTDGGGNNPSFPPTPTWGALPAATPPRPGSHVGEGPPGDLILAELRSAMAHLKDSGTALEASSTSRSSGSGVQTAPVASPAPPSAGGGGASSVLESISRGIAALGRDGLEPEDSRGGSSAAAAATVTPRMVAGASTAST